MILLSLKRWWWPDKYIGDPVYYLGGVSIVGSSLVACTHLAAVAPVVDVSAVGLLRKIL